MTSFEVGDYVWAKLTGFPHWPAKILELGKSPSDSHYVEFLGPKKTVAEAKVKSVDTDEFEKLVKAGRKAKGQAFMKSVNELQQIMPKLKKGGGAARKMNSPVSAAATKGHKVNGTASPTAAKSKSAQSPSGAARITSSTASRSPPAPASVPAAHVKKGGRWTGPTAVAVERSKIRSPPAAASSHGIHAPSPRKRPMDATDNGQPLKMAKTSAADTTSKAMATSNSCRKKYGFIGLGIMGTEMARNLLKSNHNVVVWNRSGVQHTDLPSCGAQVAVSPAEVVDRSDIVFACVSTPEAARDVVSCDDGVKEAMTRGKGYVDMSTVDPATSQFISREIHQTGGMFLEAPVSGSKKPAQDGQLVILTAGDQDLFDMATPAFNAMGKSSYFLGDVGNAAKMKLVVNMVMGSMTSALCEGLALAKEAGLSQMMLHQVLKEGALNSKMVEAKGTAVLKGDFPPAFPLKHQQKDMRLALALGDEVHQALPVAAAANETFKAAMQQGCADKDMSAVYRAHARHHK